jgi:hypothetical protein
VRVGGDIIFLGGVGHQDSRAGRPGPVRGFTRGNRLSGSETWSGKPEPGVGWALRGLPYPELDVVSHIILFWSALVMEILFI